MQLMLTPAHKTFQRVKITLFGKSTVKSSLKVRFTAPKLYLVKIYDTHFILCRTTQNSRFVARNLLFKKIMTTAGNKF